MKNHSPWIWIVALVTLGSGLFNIFSVMDPSLPHQREVWGLVVPMEFLSLRRFLTLLIGFALVVSSINIYKRKKRAFQWVLALGCFSVIVHLLKGRDYEHALLSLGLVIVLLWNRKAFTVKSSIPDLRWGLLRFAIAALVALAYGVAGFWALDPRHFGIPFNFWESIHRTLLFFSLAGDPSITPHTRYAHWFMDSLYLMSVTAFSYAGFSLFRPVIYQYATLPHERTLAAHLLEKHGRSSLDYFKTWPDKSLYLSRSQNCFLAYRVAGNFAIVLGDPVGPDGEIEEIIREFTERCTENDWGVGFHQTLPDFLPVYQRFGFKRLKIGDDAVVDLRQFTLEGKSMKRFRHTIHRLEKAGIHTRRYDPPLSDSVLSQAKRVSDQWLQIPGRRERGFSLGHFDPDYLRKTPLFVVAGKNEQILAFVNLVPSFRKGESTSDLMRHRTDVPNGVMDYLFVSLFAQERERGFERFNLRMAPMSGLEEKERETASPEERAVHFFFQYLNFLFSYRGLRQYKAKFATSWEPRYAIYRNSLDLPRLAIALSRVSAFDEEVSLDA
jgi:phosphatidylglycerol lysyltransferase